MELRERIARAIVPHMHYEDEWEEAESTDRQRALEIADDVIETLGLTREEERIEPHASSLTKFAPYTTERYTTLWSVRDKPPQTTLNPPKPYKHS